MIFDWDWPSADAAFAKALAIDPNFPDALRFINYQAGDYPVASAGFRNALELSEKFADKAAYVIAPTPSMTHCWRG